MNIFKIIKGHKTAAEEHKVTYSLKVNVTWWKAVKVTIYDLLHYKTIEKDGAYIVYATLYKPHLDAKIPFLVSMYVPTEMRGKGLMSDLLDSIPLRPILGSIDDVRATKYEKAGNLCIFR